MRSVAFCCFLVSSAAFAQVPPGDTNVTRAFVSILCPSGHCSANITISGIPTGYQDAKVFLGGWKLRRTGTDPITGKPATATVYKIGAGVGGEIYDPVLGKLTFDFDGDFYRTNSTWYDWELSLWVSVVLTRSASGSQKLSIANSNCVGNGTCTAAPTILGAVPVGAEIVGVGIRRFALTATSAGPTGIQLSRARVDSSAWLVSGSAVSVSQACSFQDATGVTPMRCDMEVLSIGVDTLTADGVSVSNADVSPAPFITTSTSPCPAGPYFRTAGGGATAFDLQLVSGASQDEVNALSADYVDWGLAANKLDYVHTRQAQFTTKASTVFSATNKGLGFCIF
jgi:hypothetical protein